MTMPGFDPYPFSILLPFFCPSSIKNQYGVPGFQIDFKKLEVDYHNNMPSKDYELI
jgi:hypothetical protein